MPPEGWRSGAGATKGPVAARRLRTPERSTIHSSLVSRIDSRSLLVTTVGGSAVPHPVMTQPRSLTNDRSHRVGRWSDVRRGRGHRPSVREYSGDRRVSGCVNPGKNVIAIGRFSAMASVGRVRSRSKTLVTEFPARSSRMSSMTSSWGPALHGCSRHQPPRPFVRPDLPPADHTPPVGTHDPGGNA